jgi:hypothetical protein
MYALSALRMHAWHAHTFRIMPQTTPAPLHLPHCCLLKDAPALVSTSLATAIAAHKASHASSSSYLATLPWCWQVYHMCIHTCMLPCKVAHAVLWAQGGWPWCRSSAAASRPSRQARAPTRCCWSTWPTPSTTLCCSTCRSEPAPGAGGTPTPHPLCPCPSIARPAHRWAQARQRPVVLWATAAAAASQPAHRAPRATAVQHAFKALLVPGPPPVPAVGWACTRLFLMGTRSEARPGNRAHPPECSQAPISPSCLHVLLGFATWALVSSRLAEAIPLQHATQHCTSLAFTSSVRAHDSCVWHVSAASLYVCRTTARRHQE